MLQDFFNDFLRYATDWAFWVVSVGVTLVAWWVFSVGIFRLFFNSSPNDPIGAARSGIFTALVLAVIGVAAGLWFGWHDLNRLIAGGIISLVAVILVTAIIFGTDRDE